MKVNCSICEHEIDTTNHAYCVKIVSWIEYRDGKYLGTPKKPSSPLGYAHKICTEVRNQFDDAPTLF